MKTRVGAGPSSRLPDGTECHLPTKSGDALAGRSAPIRQYFPHDSGGGQAEQHRRRLAVGCPGRYPHLGRAISPMPRRERLAKGLCIAARI
jgi:hypothetical protein